MIYRKNDADSVQKTSDLLLSGGIVILPTDTVYGFSGIVDLQNASPKGADKKIRAIKGRGETKPFIQLLAHPEDIFAYTNDKIPSRLLELWPGAVTVIVSVKKDAPFLEHLDTVAFRCPADVWLRDVISCVGAPIYSTSANKSGETLLTEERQLITAFEKSADALVLDGSKKNALPSTLVLLENGNISVLRQGSVQIL